MKRKSIPQRYAGLAVEDYFSRFPGRPPIREIIETAIRRAIAADRRARKRKRRGG